MCARMCVGEGGQGAETSLCLHVVVLNILWQEHQLITLACKCITYLQQSLPQAEGL